MKIDIKVVRLNGQTVTRHLRTPRGRRLTGAGTDALLKQEAERVEQFFPGLEFRLVPLHSGSFNFVEIKPEFTTETQRSPEARVNAVMMPHAGE
jgi:hypothetical protein